MSGDRLGIASLSKHEELRHDCHRLEVDGERPRDLENNNTYLFISVTQICHEVVCFPIDLEKK